MVRSSKGITTVDKSIKAIRKGLTHEIFKDFHSWPGFTLLLVKK